MTFVWTYAGSCALSLCFSIFWCAQCAAGQRGPGDSHHTKFRETASCIVELFFVVMCNSKACGTCADNFLHRTDQTPNYLEMGSFCYAGHQELHVSSVLAVVTVWLNHNSRAVVQLLRSLTFRAKVHMQLSSSRLCKGPLTLLAGALLSHAATCSWTL